MLNFTVGPVMSDSSILKEGGKSAPYFRTTEFSEIMIENEKLMLEFLNAPKNSRCIFLTASGTGAMESCVMNLLSSKDKVLVVNGGSFGQRFVEMCQLHKLDYTEIVTNVANCRYADAKLVAEGNLEDLKYTHSTHDWGI